MAAGAYVPGHASVLTQRVDCAKSPNSRSSFSLRGVERGL